MSEDFLRTPEVKVREFQQKLHRRAKADRMDAECLRLRRLTAKQKRLPERRNRKDTPRTGSEGTAAGVPVIQNQTEPLPLQSTLVFAQAPQ